MLKVIALLLAIAGTLAARSLLDDQYLFADFKNTYNRQYAASEEAHKFDCFRKNLAIIDKFNALGQEQHGINRFSDLCAEEFRAYHSLRINATATSLKKNLIPLFSAEQVRRAAAADVDWRQKGAVTTVKDQGMCGSCWSFSATGNMEGQWFLGKGQLVGLSEEELVQCSNNGNFGCNGGLMDNAFEWVAQNGGIDSESDYPYTSGSGNTGTCNNNKLQSVVAKFPTHVDFPQDEGQILTWFSQNGPVAIGVDASSGWQTYHGGIMSTCSGRQLDHGVLLVGYSGSSSTPYWVIKNSWSTGWGENGYIRVQYGTNQCGLNMVASSARV